MAGKSCLKTTLAFFVLFSLTAVSATVHAKTIYVDDDGPADFDSIQAAIDNSSHGDTIIVRPGIYTGDGNRDIDYNSKAITVRSIDPNDPNIVAATIIDCNGTEEEPHRGFYFQNGEDKNSILAGITIVNGLLYRRYPEDGGGILCQDASPTISNCVISKNWGSTGGGICIMGDNASPTILNCIIKENGASFGGGLSCHQSSPAIINCIITNNVGANDCGGIDCDSASTRVINTIITGNFAWDGDVGAICAYYHSNIMLSNCTIVGNSSYTEVGVVSINRDSSATITNCIIWGNDGEQIREGISGEATVCYTDVEGGYKGQGNIKADPKFVDAGHWTCHPFNGGTWVDGDYHLLPASPCIDAGDPNYTAEPNETDLDGRIRVMGIRIDMGAYESPVSAEARIVPRTINLASKGKWITCYIWLPEQCNVTDIKPDTILLECEIILDSLHVDELEQVATVIFSREDVLPILKIGDVNLKITGRLTDGTVFEAGDTIKVIDKAGKN